MSLRVDFLTAASPSSDGNQDFVSDQFSASEPIKASVVFAGSPTAVNTTTANARLSVGITDGTTSVGCNIGSDDAAATTVSQATLRNTSILRLINGAASSQSSATASFVSNTTLRLAWTGPDQNQIGALMIGGAGVLAHVGVASATDPGTGQTVTVTHSLGSAPNLFIVLTANGTINANSGNGLQSYGIYVPGSSSQACIHWVASSAQAAEQLAGGIDSTFVAAQQNSNATTQLYTVTISSITTTQYGVVFSADADLDAVAVLALYIPDLVASLQIVDALTSVGTTNHITGLASPAQAVINLISRRDGTGSATNDTAAIWGIGCAAKTQAGTIKQGSICASWDDASDPTVCKTYFSNTKALNVLTIAGSADIEATVSDFAANGSVAYTYTNIDTGTNKQAILAIGQTNTVAADTWSAQQVAAPTGSVTIAAGSNRRFTLPVAWNSEVGVSHTATLAVGGVEGTKSASLTQGSTNFSGIDIWTWDETAIAAMSGSSITTPSGSYPATTSWAYNTVTAVGSLTTPGLQTGTGTSINIGSPYGQPADYAIIIACSNATSGTYDPNPTNGTAYTEIIDALTSSGRPHFGLFTKTDSPQHTSSNSTITQSVTSGRFCAVHLGFISTTSTPTITDVSAITNGGTFTIPGTNLDQIATVELIDDQGHRVGQTISAQSATEITCTFVRGTLRYTSGSVARLIATTTLGVEITSDVDILPQSGWSFVTITQLAAPTDRIETTATDLAVGDQVAAEATAGLRADGGLDTIAEATTDFDAEVHDGTGWGTTGTITRQDLTVSAIVPDVSSDHPLYADAEIELIAASLTAFLAGEAYSLTISAGRVISQDPPATTEVEEDSAVSLITSRGAPAGTNVYSRMTLRLGLGI